MTRNIVAFAASTVVVAGVLIGQYLWHQQSVLGTTITAAPASVNQVAITFDDGPSQHTAAILAILADQQATATFFVVGQEIDHYPDTLPAIVAAGHELGNHSNTHPRWRWSSQATIAQELLITDEKIAALTNQRPTLFRSPYGIDPPGLAATLDILGWQHIGWSVDPEDWKKGQTGKSIATAVLADVEPGSIILLHDGPSSQDRSATIEALPLIMSGLRERGLEPVTISQLLKFDIEIE